MKPRVPLLKLRLISLFSVLMVGLVNTLHSSDEPTVPLASPPAAQQSASFTARVSHFHAPSGQVLMEVRLWVAPQGIRIDQLPLSEGLSIIIHHARESLWLVDTRHRLYHRVPLMPAGDDTANEVPASEPPATVLAELALTAPCASKHAVHDSSDRVNGLILQLWRCMQKDGTVLMRWFDDELGLVVKTRAGNGLTTTLSDVRKRRLTEHHFLPPSGYRSVGIEEFLGGMPVLSRYRQRTDIQ